MTPSKGMARVTKNSELRDVSFVFRNLFKTGSISASDIMKNAADMLPKHREHLLAARHAINTKGETFSDALGDLFDESVTTIIKAGEASGTLPHVFDRIWSNAKTQIEIDKAISKLNMPIAITAVAVVVSFLMMLLLVPYIYKSQASSVPPDFEPFIVVKISLWLNEVVMGNLTAFMIAGGVISGAILIAFTRPEVVNASKNILVKIIIRNNFLGKPFSSLKFGVLAQYIEIVSSAGLDADKRIDLVLKSLPEPLRPGLLSFRRDFLIRGMKFAARPEGKPEHDPRHSEVLWPTYIRLAFTQADEGDWSGPMREFGEVLIDDGKENIQLRIQSLMVFAYITAGLLMVIPYLSIYSVMGQLMQINLQNM